MYGGDTRELSGQHVVDRAHGRTHEILALDRGEGTGDGDLFLYAIGYDLHALQAGGFFLERDPHVAAGCHGLGDITYIRDFQLSSRLRFNGEITVEIGDSALCGIASHDDDGCADDCFTVLVNHVAADDLLGLLQAFGPCGLRCDEGWREHQRCCHECRTQDFLALNRVGWVHLL